MFINIKLERCIPKNDFGIRNPTSEQKIENNGKIELFQKLFYKFILCLTNCTGPPLKYL